VFTQIVGVVEVNGLRGHTWVAFLDLLTKAFQSRSFSALPAPLSFLNTNKYPASFSFLLMTLVPVIALMPWLEHARGRFAAPVALFGPVLFFYDMLYIPWIHLAAVVACFFIHGEVSSWLFTNHPMRNPLPPEGYP
jgi:hypothetical protein